jgi:hypothetical protein
MLGEPFGLDQELRMNKPGHRLMPRREFS